ncbi:sodium:solute symporter [Engelhardtia mirabilis]|uniref:Sodium/glucose cotransporter n=1 Tax=Engelhardtia mirabilis TaxID=2528011 RepID=A0A518BHL6_9BACT|nr:Sodium/glucose cotransporter [Planctomycetes bacterium Pla133]QDV00806.1 Sodium/glucose cotransporter [Planctomycetes bacterium Pla86]
MTLGAIDLAVLALYMAGALVLGLWVGRGQRSVDSYLVGGRDLPWWAILGSIVATETSTATVLSVPGLAYAQGTGDLRFLQLPLGYLVGRVLITLFLLPAYFRGAIVSAYEILRERFGGSTERTASLIFLVTRNLIDGLRLFLTAIALEQVLGWPLLTCVMLIASVTIVYTAFGGMRSIVWNDCVQLVVYLLGGVAVLWVAVDGLPGGFDELARFGAETGRWRVIDPTWSLADPMVLIAGLVGGTFLTLGVHGTDQMLVQRYLSARSQRDAGRALIGSGFVVIAQFALFLVVGVALAAHESAHGVQPVSGDRALARFVVEELPRNVGLVGLILAAIFAATMSTLSSSLSASASTLVSDWIRPLCKREPEPRRLLAWTRVATVAFAALQVVVVLGAVGISRSVVTEALAVAGFSAGLLLGVFALALLVPRADQRAALVGLVAGTLCLLGVRFGLPHLGLAVAWPWYPVVGSLTVVTVGVASAALRHRDA